MFSSTTTIILTQTRARIVATDAETPFAGITLIAFLATFKTSITVFRDKIVPSLSLGLGCRREPITMSAGAENYEAQRVRGGLDVKAYSPRISFMLCDICSFVSMEFSVTHYQCFTPA